jgi:hypothetical protein
MELNALNLVASARPEDLAAAGPEGVQPALLTLLSASLSWIVLQNEPSGDSAPQSKIN